MDQNSRTLWERVCATVNRLGTPRSPRLPIIVEPDPASVLDLHGMGIHAAFHATKAFVSRSDAPRRLTIITGKSGRMCYELPDWLLQFSTVKSCTQMKGGGAYEIRLRD